MNTQEHLAHKVLRFVLGILTTIWILPIIIIGAAEIVTLYRVHAGHIYYVERFFLGGFGIGFFLFGVAMLALVIYIVRGQPKLVSLWRLCIPMGLGLWAYMAIPCFVSFGNGASFVRSTLAYSSDALALWMTRHGQLPDSQEELQKALQEYGDKDLWKSPYTRNGQPIPYEFVYISNASGPYIESSPNQRPAMVYCAIDQHHQQFWLTATVLKDGAGNTSVYLKKHPGTDVFVQKKDDIQ